MESTWKSTPAVVEHSLSSSRRSVVVRYRALILIFTFIIYTTYHLSRKPISVVKSVLHNSCNKSQPNCSHGWKPFDGPDYQTVLGSIDYAFLFAYAIGMFISGHIAERTNLRYFLFVGMCFSGLFTALFGLGRYWNIHSLSFFIGVQIIGGLVQSSGWPAVVTCVANWFGKGRRGLVMGLWNSHTSVGNIVGSLIAGAFVERDWALSFIVPGLIIMFMSLPVLFFLVPHPDDVGIHSPNVDESNGLKDGAFARKAHRFSEVKPLIAEETTETTQPHAVSFMQALRIPGVVEFSLCLFFAKLVSYTFLFWLPSYIENTAHFSPGISADLSTIFDVGGIVGGVFAGVVSDYLGGRALTCMVMLLFAAPSMFLYDAFGSRNLAVSIVLLAVCGALVNGPYCLITTAVSADLGTHRSLQGNKMALATVTAIIDGTGSVGAALGPFLTGIISPTGWQNVFYMLIAADITALVISSYIYFKYDRSAAAVVASSLDGTNECRCKVTVKPPCCRLSLLNWLMVSSTVLLVSLLGIILPEAYYHRNGR